MAASIRTRFLNCLQLFDVSNDNFTQKSLVCSYASLALSSTAYFGSLFLIVGIVSYDLPIKWSFIVYMVTSGLLYLMNILSNSLIISTKSMALSTEGGIISMRSSMLRNRIRESPDTRLTIQRAEGFRQEEVRNEVETKTPPPPYEDSLGGSAESTLVSPNRPHNQEPVSEDVKELLNKILFAVNNRTCSSELLHRTQDAKCNNCQSQVACSGTSRVSQRNRTIPTSSEYGIYPQLPEEVLEHFSDPNAFVKALAKYQSPNKMKKYEGNRKKQIENQELLNKQGFQNQVIQDLDYLTSSRQKNLMATHYEYLMPISKNSPRKIQQQRLKSKTQMAFELRNPASSLAVPEWPKQIRNFNSEDKSIHPTKASQSDFSPISPENTTFTNSKEGFQDHRTPKFSQYDRSSPKFPQHGRSSPRISQHDRSSPRISQHDRSSPRISQHDRSSPKFSQHDRSCPKFSQHDRSSPRIFRHDGTFTKKKVTPDQRLPSPKISHIAAVNQMENPVIVLDPPSPTACQQDLSPKTSIFSQKDLGVTSPRILQDIGSVNQIGIPLKDYTLNRSESKPEISKSEESICWTNFERGQALSTPNMPLRRARSTHAMHQTTPKAIGRESKAESASNSYPLLDIAVKNFSKESAEYHMDPKEWLAAWSNGLNKITSSDTSTLLGSRL